MNIISPDFYRQLASFYRCSCAVNHQLVENQIRQQGFAKIGEGGFGSIYSDGQTAVKFLRPCDGEMLARSHEHEINALSFLHEENFRSVPALYGVQGQGMNKLIRMEYLSSYMSFFNLQEQLVRNNEALSEQIMTPLAELLFQRLDELHSIGVAHTDIKPDNVMLCRQTLDVKLLDFNKCQRHPYLQSQPGLVAMYAPGFNPRYTVGSFAEMAFLDEFGAAVTLWETFNIQRITGDSLLKSDFGPGDVKHVLQRRQIIQEGCFGQERIWRALCRGFDGL